MTKEESSKIFSFMSPGAGIFVLGHSHIGSENAISLLLFLCTLGLGSDKLSIIVMMTKGRVYQNCKFHDPWDRGSYAKVWSYKSL